MKFHSNTLRAVTCKRPLLATSVCTAACHCTRCFQEWIHMLGAKMSYVLRSISFCPVSKLKQRRYLSPGLLLTGLCQVWFHLKKRPESILCFLYVCRDRLLLVSAAELEKCVSGTAPLAAPLSWLAGAVASHRQSYSLPRPMAVQESGAGSLKVAKTTTFEWVCSWNAARQRYITEGERCGRGSRPGST